MRFPASRPRRPLSSAIACLAVIGALVPALARGQQQPQTREEKAASRPPQTPVLAENSVLHANQAYGPEELQRLDVYAPKGAARAPVVVFVHGGEWTRGDKEAVSYKPQFFNQNGIVFVSTNYRLTPPATHPAHLDDVAAAVGWVYEHAVEFGGDPQKIVLMGHSAGCHLASLVALDPRYLAKVGRTPADLRGVVAWSGGSYDLVQKVEQGGAYADYIRKAFGESPDTWRDASPIEHVKNAKGGPQFLFVSIEPGHPSTLAAERMVKQIGEAGGQATAKMIEGRDHFGANHYLGAPDDTSGAVLLEFVTAATR